MNVNDRVLQNESVASQNLQRLDRALNDWVLASESDAEMHRRWNLKIGIKQMFGPMPDVTIEIAATTLLEHLPELLSDNFSTDRARELLTPVAA